MNKVQRAIIHSIDVAFSNTIVDKSQFYEILETKYGKKRQYIADDYSVFNRALAETYGAAHFKIEREILHVLHDLTRIGLCRLTDEIPAFITIVESNIDESNRCVEEARRRFDIIKAMLDKTRNA